MAEKFTLEEFFNLLKKYNVEELEGVRIEGDLEIEIEPGAAVDPNTINALLALTQYVNLIQEFGKFLYHANMALTYLQRLSQAFGIQLPVAAPQPQVPEVKPTVEVPKIKIPEKLKEAKFEPYKVEYPGKIEEVTLGATRAEGGTREVTITVGGERSLAFYTFDAEMPHLPVIAIDVFDRRPMLAKAVREHYEDVLDDPAEWARKAVREFGADLVTLHLISTDPLLDDRPASEAAKTVEEVLQAVKVPLIIGGSGNKEKDPEVLEKAAEVAEGERVMLASATLDMDWERIGNAAKKYGHVVLSWTQMDINNQKTLNRYLLKRVGLPRDSLIMDPTTAALGYGLDYAFTNMERIRISGLRGDQDLNFPISSGTTNAWGAREAWMKDSPIEEDTPWGPRELRGPIWEIVTGLTLALAGVDIFMMMHPGAVAVLKEIINTLAGKIAEKADENAWLTMEG
ncbi:CO dehydrogenase/acetyl-CoA synthase, delta subunit [Ferroglobus placidus DSM 10642]|uniref:Acetyl-CoA decarbonylase/synthase complex subunit delta n=1 Tax=Ferroglobus placidus (strain DSM 10642 / AEDII12DO) TaxID=589924 RepID=D3RWP2_FERPA|nr:CO dehydrogenase/acetyl-CoA synthase subunit delta [Ferroglobus placidus]ADC64905.1 CO dehydrogenase/acetyl-CoA synthase, delta subunit [Ferroglobus placidus DSM 10642]